MGATGKDVRPVRTALLSVSDRTDLDVLARALAARGVRLVASGGTRDHLAKAGIETEPVESFTGSPEILGGRVKTLSSRLHAAVLARRDRPEDLATLERLGIPPIDLVVVNFYDLGVRGPGDSEDGVDPERIDVGGPAVVRAAAKNHRFVAVVTHPSDYTDVVEEIERTGAISQETRRRLARAAFARTTRYDAVIARRLDADVPPGAGVPVGFAPGAVEVVPLRYGENPHQAASLLLPAGGAPRQIHGKPLSFNNVLDADAAWAVVTEHDRPAACVVKHAAPSGFAVADDASEALRLGWATDPVSAFGGVVAVNRPLDLPLAEAIIEGRPFIEVIIVPEASDEAMDRVAAGVRGGKNLRIVLAPGTLPAGWRDLRRTAWGYLTQEPDRAQPGSWPGQIAGARAPSVEEAGDLELAWRLVRHVRSNAVVLVRGGAAVGIGGGQPSRVDAVRQALRRAEGRAEGAVLASDGFFPFPDAVEEAARAGVRAVVQPGGSVRDAEVTAAADRAGLAMVLTGIRHFRH